MIRPLLLWASRRPGLGRAAARTWFVRRGVRRFIPGESRGDALRAAVELGSEGVPTVLTLLGEDLSTSRQVGATVAEYRALLGEIGDRELDAHLSVKLTQLGLSLGGSGAHLALATHDRALVTRMRDWIAREGLSATRYEFQMLYGIGVALRRELTAAGEPVRVLISYGPGWFSWYMRRLAERPANLWFLGKAIFRA